MSGRLEAWRRDASELRITGRRISFHERGSDGPVLLLLHGFPSSSYDWQPLLGQDLPPARVIAPDFLGFGLSEKPRDHTYSLFWQADMVEALIAERASGAPVVICAHDMGTSVATELLARDCEQQLGFELAGTLLFNGSIVIERASLTWAQKLLRSSVGPLAARLTNRQVFSRQFSRLFSDAHPISVEELADQWELICEGGGRTLGNRLVHYLGERVEHAERWHGAINEWPGELRLMWGLADPVATTAVLEALIELRPAVPVERLEGVGHYPQTEVPARVAGVVAEAVAASL